MDAPISLTPDKASLAGRARTIAGMVKTLVAELPEQNGLLHTRQMAADAAQLLSWVADDLQRVAT